MKSSEARIELQQGAEDALRSVLSQVSTIRLKEIRHKEPSSRVKSRFVAKVEVVGRSQALSCQFLIGDSKVDLDKMLVELRAFAAQSDVDGVPVLIAQRLSSEEQAVCRQQNVAFVDFEGNARLCLGEVFILKRSIGARSPHPTPVKTLTAQVSQMRPSAPAVFVASNIPGAKTQVHGPKPAVIGA
jgi:hypothetical protein